MAGAGSGTKLRGGGLRGGGRRGHASGAGHGKSAARRGTARPPRKKRAHTPNFPQLRQTALYFSLRPSQRPHERLGRCPTIALPACTRIGMHLQAAQPLTSHLRPTLRPLQHWTQGQESACIFCSTNSVQGLAARRTSQEARGLLADQVEPQRSRTRHGICAGVRGVAADVADDFKKGSRPQALKKAGVDNKQLNPPDEKTQKTRESLPSSKLLHIVLGHWSWHWGVAAK